MNMIGEKGDYIYTRRRFEEYMNYLRSYKISVERLQ